MPGMTDLSTALDDAIGVFDQQVAEAFSLNDSCEIAWRHGDATHALARFEKTDEFYAPRIVLLCSMTDAQQETILQRVALWWHEYKQKHLGTLLALENPELKDAPKALAQELYRAGGLVQRERVKEALTKLEKEDRQALNKLGLRIGAFYIYHRDMLKPGAMKALSMLWRIANDKQAGTYTLPHDGNVSMAAPENADKDFYLAIGLLVFGKSCVRVDMIERINSAIFDGAVEGKYTFDPALASTIGASVEMIYGILQDLGFPFEEKTIGEGEAAKTVRLYSLKRARPKKDEPKRSPKPTFKKTVEKRRKASAVPDRKPAAAPQKPGGYNAFAGLAALRDSAKTS